MKNSRPAILPLLLAALFSNCKKDCPEPLFEIKGSGNSAPAVVEFKMPNGQSNITFISWDFGDGNIEIGNTSTKHTYAQPGEYEVVLTVGNNDKDCKSRSLPQKVFINVAIPAPVADFLFNVPADCPPPCLVQFTNNSTNSTNYQWDFATGSGSSEANPSASFNAGAFPVRLISTGPSGKDTVTKIVTIAQPAPLPVANFSVTNNGCTAPCEVYFNNSSSNANQYQWQFGDGNTSSSANPSHQYFNSGNYYVTLTASGAGGAHSTSQQVTIGQSASQPVANFSVTNNGCTAPCEVYFNNSSSNANQYQWQFGDGNTSSSANPSHQYFNSGNYYVTLTASGAGGAHSTSQQVTIGQSASQPVANFSVTNNGCTAPCEVYFNNSSSNANQYQWQFGDGNTSSSANPSHQYFNSGIYYTTLTASGPGGSSSTSQQVTISSQAPSNAQIDWVVLNNAPQLCSYYNEPDFYFNLWVWNGSGWNNLGASYVAYSYPPATILAPSSLPFLNSSDSYYISFYLYDTGQGCWTGDSKSFNLAQYVNQSSVDISSGDVSASIILNW